MNIRKILSFALGPIATALLGFVSVPAVAWAFTPEDVGRINLVQIVVSFAILLFSLGLDQAYVREFHEAPHLASLLKNCFTPGLVLLFCVAVPSAIFADRFSFLLFGLSDSVYFWVTLACVLAAFISRFLSLILRMQERALAFSMSQMVPKAIFLLLIGFIILSGFPRNFLQLLLAFCASTVAVLLIFIWNTRKQWKPALRASIDLAQLRFLLKYSIPLIFSGLAYWGLSATSALMLRSLSSFSELGIYTVSMSVAGIAIIVQSIFAVIWTPVVYRWVAIGADMSRVDRVARQGLAVVSGVFVMCGMFSWLIDYFLPIRYTEVKYLVLCSIAQPLLYTLSEVTCVGITITRRTMLSFWSTLVALVVNLGLNMLLVPGHGASGAVVANAFAYLVFFIARTEFSAYVWRSIPRVKLYVFTSGAFFLSCLTVILGPKSGNWYSVVWLAILPVVVWSFRNEGHAVLRILRGEIRRRGAVVDG